MKELKIDPEFQALIPPLSGEEFSQLEENVKADGCRDALVVWQGIIVDGHNRYSICRENDIPFKTEEKEFADRDTAAEWIIRNQFGRRNLNPAQRCELAMKLKPRIQEQAKENQGGFKGNQYKTGSRQNSDKDQKLDTYDELAKIAGVSSDTIRKTEKIFQKGTSEQIDRVRKGGKGNSVNAVHNEVTGKTNPVRMKPKVEQEPMRVTEEEIVAQGIASANETLSRKIAGMKPIHEPMTKEEKKEMAESIRNFKNPNRVSETTIDTVILELKGVLEAAFQPLEITLRGCGEFLRDEENNKKIMAVLSEAVATINEWKGKYSYERL